MTSQPLCMKPHPICRATYTLYVLHDSHYSVSSLSLYWQHHTHSVWHHTSHIFGIFWTIQDITYLLYDIKPPFLGHHMHYIWHRIYCACVITSTVLMISHQLNFWDIICYIWWHNIHCILHHSHWMCVITPTFSTIKHPLSVGHHTHYMYNIIYTV